jgi:hypothetical protein
MTSNPYRSVISIYLNSRGFAFVRFKRLVTARDWNIVDWSIVEARGDKREQIVTRVESWFASFAQNQPHTVVLQDTSHTGTHRPHRIRHLNQAIAKLAQRYRLPTAFVSRSEVRRHFSYLGNITKDSIAAAIAEHIQDFKRLRVLPPPRKPWQSEDARMGIFDAAALALTFFYKDARDSSDELGRVLINPRRS